MANESFKALRALVVDDVSFTLMRLRQTLERLGVPEVQAAANGVEACALMESGTARPNLVVSDYQMREMDGLQLLKRIRTGGVAGVPHDIVFLIVTGYLELDRSIPAVRLGADGVLRKPITAGAAEAKLALLFGPEPPRDVRDPASYEGVELDTGGPLDAEIAPAAPGAEQELPILKVAPGAVLARDLTYPNGKPLLPKGAVLAPALLYRLQEVADLSGGITRLWVRA